MSKKHFVLVMRCVLLASLCLSYHCFAETEMMWFDANELRVDGRGWEHTPTPFCRLPETVKDDVPASVWGLSHDSAGLIVHFNTNASDIAFRWTLTDGKLEMPHMPATGVSGIDLYRQSDEGVWCFSHNGRPTASENEMAVRISNPGSKLHEYKLYLPLYNGIKSLEIGVSKGAVFSQPPVSKKKPIVYYGTSIAQGGCASRPGMAFTAMLDRMLDRPIINLGFSGSGKMEPIMGQTIAEIDAEVFVIDCIWNVWPEKDELIEERTTGLIKAIRDRHPDTPILFVGQSHISRSHPTVTTKALLKAFEESVDAGVQGLYFLGGDDLVGKDQDGTVDGCHPNDLGMRRHADVLAPAIQKLEEKDRKTMSTKEAVLFVGSSSIQRWDLSGSFPDLDVINRGLGGSQIVDTNKFIKRIVMVYAPKIVVFYAGDNDIAAGKSPERVFEDYKIFVHLLREEFPGTPVVYIAIKPSISRWKLVGKMREANGLIREYIEKDERMAFADVDTPMIGADGKPRKKLFLDDGLHLNVNGYKVWTGVVRPLLDKYGARPSGI